MEVPIVNRRAELTGRTGHNFNYATGALGFDASDGPAFLSLSIEHQLAFPSDELPKRYRVDKDGRRVLIGLSIEETFEFETIEELAPMDETGARIAWSDGVPLTSREKRWLKLYQKHDHAWRDRLAKRVVQPKRK